MRLGVVILPEARWPDAVHCWQRAEELGFDHAWTYDHLAWRSLRDAPWFGAIPTLTAAACATSRIRLGPLVASANFRHPVPFAKELMTLDDISNGRLTIGVGAGGEGWDAEMFGEQPWSPRERTARFEEFVVLLDELLRNLATTRHGRYYGAREARSIPGCVQRPRPPLAIAATGARGMTLAATHGDLWVTTGDRSGAGPVGSRDGAAMVGAQIARLRAECARVGRDPGSIDKLVLTGPQLSSCTESVSDFCAAVERYETVGVTDLVVHWPRADEPYAGSLDAFERAVTQR